MAISPNDNFIAGQILTAVECNQFPRGVMQFTKHITNVVYSTDTTIITMTPFTAVANRYYRITFYMPQLSQSGAGFATMKIKNGATVLNTAFAAMPALNGYEGIAIAVETLTAGSVTLTGTLTASTASGATNNTATIYGFMLVEDIGPA